MYDCEQQSFLLLLLTLKKKNKKFFFKRMQSGLFLIIIQNCNCFFFLNIFLLWGKERFVSPEPPIYPPRRRRRHHKKFPTITIAFCCWSFVFVFFPAIETKPTKIIPKEPERTQITFVKPKLKPHEDPVQRNDIFEPDRQPGKEEENIERSSTEHENTVIMDPKHEDRATSFFAQPGILAG